MIQMYPYNEITYDIIIQLQFNVFGYQNNQQIQVINYYSLFNNKTQQQNWMGQDCSRQHVKQMRKSMEFGCCQHNLKCFKEDDVDIFGFMDDIGLQRLLDSKQKQTAISKKPVKSPNYIDNQSDQTDTLPKIPELLSRLAQQENSKDYNYSIQADNKLASTDELKYNIQRSLINGNFPIKNITKIESIMMDDEDDKQNLQSSNQKYQTKNWPSKCGQKYRTFDIKNLKVNQDLPDELYRLKMMKLISKDADGCNSEQGENWSNFLSGINKAQFMNSIYSKNPNNMSIASPEALAQESNYINFKSISNQDTIVGSIPQGQGSLYFKNGDILTGYFVEGRCYGKIKYVTSIGSYYYGYFKDGQADGFGFYSNSSGYKYEGEWKRNKPNGKGKVTYIDNSTYIGQLKSGQRYGRGLLVQRGFTYQGDFYQDKFQGSGCLRSDNGQIYEGQWQNNQKNGFGQYRWPNGDKYKGFYKNNKRQGRGTMWYHNGQIYDGEWNHGMKEGNGMHRSLQEKLTGQWQKSKFIVNAKRN